MSNLISANLPSEDEEDQDYVPDELDEEEKEARKQNKKPKRLRNAAAGAGTPDDEAGDEVGDDLDDSDAGMPDSKREAKKARVDAIWSRLHGGEVDGKSAQRAGGIASLASLCRPAGSGRKAAADDAWMRQLGLASKPKAPKSREQQGPEQKNSAAAAALAAAKAAASVAGASRAGTVTIAEQRRFAGQTITVNKEVAADSKEAHRVASEAESAARKQAGLDAVLASLQQAKKVTVLDKSRSDWKDFKQGDDGLEEELEMHKRSGDQYLDRQAFLQAAEVREYERERDRRLASDVRNRGRL